MSYVLTPEERAKAEAIARLRRNPQAWARYQAAEALRAQREQEIAQQKQEDAQATAQNNALIGTVAAPVGTIGGLALANHFLNSGSAATTALTGDATTGGSLGSAAGAGAGSAGALSAPQLVSVSPTTSATGAAATGGTSAAETGSALGSAAPYLGLAGAGLGAYGLYQGFGKGDARGGALSGSALGGGLAAASPLLLGTGPVGWGALALGAGLGALGGGLVGSIKSGKHEDQNRRDDVRANLQQSGLLDNNYNLKLANGGLFDIGKDGGPRAEYGGRRPYELDFSGGAKPYQGDTIAAVNPLAEIVTNGDDKLRSDFAGYFTNAAMSNAGDVNAARQNALAFYKQAGLDANKATSAINQLEQAGKITKDEANVYRAGIGQVFGQPQNPALPAQPTPPSPGIGALPTRPLPAGPRPWGR